jgi:hypothetical protein
VSRIVAIIVAFNFVLLFFFVPETFWDRTPRPKKRPDRRAPLVLAVHQPQPAVTHHDKVAVYKPSGFPGTTDDEDTSLEEKHSHQDARVGWAENLEEGPVSELPATVSKSNDIADQRDLERSQGDDLDLADADIRISRTNTNQLSTPTPSPFVYTEELRKQPRLKFAQTLRPWNGRLRKDNWFRAAFRPLILYAYPAVLWSALVYSLSVGWLIVLSESVASIYQHNPYNFNPLATGLVYLSPFIGGILGTVVAGRVSDIIVRFMTRRNDGVYEPEFRLVMAIPVALCTSLGLMGFGWSADVGDKWIVPTIFFGVISFGCTLGSTTAITFCVDSYRQYAGEALVTLNFSKSNHPPQPTFPFPFPSFFTLTQFTNTLHPLQTYSTASSSPSSLTAG